ncbi:hypothetical protein SAMN05444156_0249 [Verrucomicrobium sp. GAS474]|uniref:TlpA family protein disulfide reductase n=1 Tax=Verrucomicrobium sp. GAS474 TaxID=1882831 RepID=UPI00087D8001|nr:hypothetical protein [Verrucomicrobium sp. GAS474]SDT86921.1 hypothetical protein SAMN05444156_0249 [Verrucomicrobium sp. GAS474]
MARPTPLALLALTLALAPLALPLSPAHGQESAASRDTPPSADTKEKEPAALPPEVEFLIGKPAPEIQYNLKVGLTHTLAESKGRWVLLTFDIPWCTPSESLSIALSDIQEELKDQPFDFIQLNDSPSIDDVELMTAYAFHGKQAVSASRDPAWKIRFYPTSFLINPAGVIVWAGTEHDNTALRALLATQIGNAFPLPEGFATPSPLRQAEQKALAAFEDNHPEEAHAQFDALLQQNPDDPWLRRWCARSLGWLQKAKPSSAEWLGKELQEPTHVTDPLLYALLRDQPPATQATPRPAPYEVLLVRHPDSYMLRAYQIAATKTPETLTADEIKLLFRATPEQPPDSVLSLALFALEKRTEPLRKPTASSSQALALVKSDAALDVAFITLGAAHETRTFFPLLQAASLARRNEAEKARGLILKIDGDLTPETSDRASSYNAMLRHAAILDWPSTVAYAAKHTQTTPWNAAGAVFRLYAALRTKDPAAKDAAWQELLNFKTDRKAYLYAQQVMRGEAAPTANDVRTWSKDQYGYITLLWVAAALEANGKAAEAAEVNRQHLATLSFNTDYTRLLTLDDALRKAAPATTTASASP